MTIKIPSKIPISIRPSFWLVSALIGFLYSQSLVGTLIWVGIIFISVLFHEMGHALTAYGFGMKPRIELVAMGGVTYHQGESLPFWKKFFIIFNGPFFGFLLFVIATVLLQFKAVAVSPIAPVLALIQVVNLFWTIVNLIPVIPLDGGQILRVVLEAIFGVKGFRYSLISGAVFAIGVSLFFFLYHQLFIGALFFLFAYQSFDAWKNSKTMAEQDRSEDVKSRFLKAEEMLQLGHKDEAMLLFSNLHKELKSGVIYLSATQYLAFLEYEKGNILIAYDLLKKIKKHLAPDAICLLHKAAFEEKDYQLVSELSSECFQLHPTVDTALRNAYASGLLSLVDPSIGWLETAVREGLDNIEEICSLSFFDPIRSSERFDKWLQSHKKKDH